MSGTRCIARGALGIVFLALVVLGSCRAPMTVYYNAPSLAPGTRPEMNTAGFWIGRHPDPDAVIMTDADILWFNEHVRVKTGAVYDVLRLSPERDGLSLKGSLRRVLGYVSSKGYVTRDGRKASAAFLPAMKAAVNIDGIPARVQVRWGLAVNNCDQRLLPSAQPLYRSPTDTNIDRLQNNTLDIATPMVVLHQSIGGEWLYVISPFSDGWVEARNVALCTRDEIADFQVSPSFIVVTDAKADLFGDPALRRHSSYLHMGVRLPVFVEPETEVIQVRVPSRTGDGRCAFEAAYVGGAQVSRGYLAYTPRNAIRQAFKLLHAPYGWGGLYGEQDCSRFIQEVFATMGIVMPRNSTQQAKVGRAVASFGKKTAGTERSLALAGQATGGITLLQFPGHIMLFLGMVDGTPYAIHDIFAYTEPAEPAERLMAINRVAVTSLALGSGTKKGSLLERLAMVRSVAGE